VTERESYRTGMAKRREILGDAYVDANLAASDDFMMAFQDQVTEQVWARAWTGTAIDRKSKGLITLAILAALGRFQEVSIYTRVALDSGASVEEIKETMISVTAYCGAPAGRQAFLAAHDALVAAGVLAATAPLPSR